MRIQPGSSSAIQGLKPSTACRQEPHSWAGSSRQRALALQEVSREQEAEAPQARSRRHEREARVLGLRQADQEASREPEEDRPEALLRPLADRQGSRAAEAGVNEQRVVAKPSHRACLGDKRSWVRIPPTRSESDATGPAQDSARKHAWAVTIETRVFEPSLYVLCLTEREQGLRTKSFATSSTHDVAKLWVVQLEVSRTSMGVTSAVTAHVFTIRGSSSVAEQEPSKLKAVGASPISRFDAHVAQSAEHVPGKDEVVSAILTMGLEDLHARRLPASQ